jgi:purine-binding chemotaxis protein CheW
LATRAEERSVGEGRVALACVELAGRRFAIDVRELREIVRAPDLTPLPGAPALIEGVVDLRGALLPVVDLGRALGLEPAGMGGARLAVVEVEGLRFALRVDAALDVLSLGAEALEAPPELARLAGCEGVRALARREGAPPLPVLRLERLLESVRRSGGRPAEEAR